MIVHLCDRCGAAADLHDKPLNVTVPANDPSTQPVQSGQTISMQVLTPDVELCPACLASTLLEYALTRLGPSILAPIAQALALRANAVVKA